MAPSELSMAIVSYEWQTAIQLAKSNPSLARQSSIRLGFFEGRKESNVLPLHEAVNGVAPAEVAQAVLEAYPDAVKATESAYKRLPLHCACRRNANPVVVKLLLEAHLDAALIPDNLGRLPIHYALSNGADPQIVNMLLEYSPAAARGVDTRGWTPLHVACSVGAEMAIIRRLLEINPDAVVFRTDKGSAAGGLIPKDCYHKQELKQLLKEARRKFDSSFVNPLLAEPPKVEDMLLV